MDGFDPENNFELLKAYIKNDTNFLIQFRKNEDLDKQRQHQWDVMDSCIHQPKLQDLHVDEAYRFNFLMAFCPYKLDITISKRDSNVNLHFVIYQYQWDTAIGRIVNEYDKKLTIKDWNDFKDEVAHADFWGLKEKNGEGGVDGNDIIVSGYIIGDSSLHRPARFNLVRRWLINRTSLGDPFRLVVKLSGNRQGCYWIE